MKKIKYLLEAIIANILYGMLYILPVDMASSIGAFFTSKLGPKLGISARARKNIKKAFPDLSEQEIDKIITKMWDNFGRTFAELPHIAKIKGADFDKIADVEGISHIKKYTASKKPVIFFSGHFANWELTPKSIFEKGCPLALVYRKSNNPFSEKIIIRVRNNYQASAIPKGSVGARKLINAVKNGGKIGMLIDQKQNDGIDVPFFGTKVKTASAIAHLALKYDCTLIPTQVIRTDGANFKVIIHPPMKFKKTGNRTKDILDIMTRINTYIEDWIRQNPAQWLWLHNRWPN